MKNIVLIGMPGSGKSTVGVVLAKMLGLHFLDSDLVIQETEGKLLSEIIEEKGPDGFLAVEDRVNAGLQCEKTVIATGGSAVFGANAMAHLKEIGTVVYLKLSYEELTTRLGNLKGRGVVLRDGQTLKDLYDERIPLYEKYADVIVDAEGYDIEGLMDEVVHELQKITEFE